MPSGGTAKKAPSLKQLVAKLKETQSSLLDIWKFVEGFKQGTKLSQVEVRLAKLDLLWEVRRDTN